MPTIPTPKPHPWRHSMPGARTRSVESPCVSYDGFSLNRTAYTEGAEGTEAIVTSRFRIHFMLPTSRFRLRMWARTEGAEGTEAIVTSRFRLHFMLPTSRFRLRKAPTADPLATIHVCASSFLQKIIKQTIDKNTV